MKFALSAVLLSLAGLATAGSILPRHTCSEADKFGSLTISNPNGATSYKPGDKISVYADYTCPIASGIIPNLISCAIDPTVPVSGFRNTFVLDGRTVPHGDTSQNITMQIPTKYIFPNGTLYNFVCTEYSSTKNPDGTQNSLTHNLTVPITIVSLGGTTSAGDLNPGR